MSIADHGALVATTVKTVTLNSDQFYWVGITCRTPGSEIFMTLDGTTPNVGGAGTYLVNGFRAFRVDQLDQITVKMISSGTPNYSVEVFN